MVSRLWQQVERTLLGLTALAVSGAAVAEPRKPTEPKPDPEEKKKAEEPEETFELTPRGILAVNAVYGTHRVNPGPYAFFVIRPEIGPDVFEVSANNSSIGFALEGVSYGGFDFVAAVDANLKSPTPLLAVNALAPQFNNLYVAARSEQVRLTFGQQPDVVLPFLPRTTNGFPGSFLPGQVGYFRPQLRADVRFPIDRHQIVVKMSGGRPVQTFDLTDELKGAGSNVPDAQGRVVFATGEVRRDDPWLRNYQVAVSGHVGERLFATLESLANPVKRTTWSVGADLNLMLPTGTTIRARLWRGALLGDYGAGVFQTVSVSTLGVIHASGGTVEVAQELRDWLRLGAGYGRDSPKVADLDPGDRDLNEAFFANVFIDLHQRIGVAFEASLWRTGYVGAGTSDAWRGELASFLRF